MEFWGRCVVLLSNFLLVFFSIAAEQMQKKSFFGEIERTGNNYYDPLCELLKIDPENDYFIFGGNKETISKIRMINTNKKTQPFTQGTSHYYHVD